MSIKEKKLKAITMCIGNEVHRVKDGKDGCKVKLDSTLYNYPVTIGNGFSYHLSMVDEYVKDTDTGTRYEIKHIIGHDIELIDVLAYIRSMMINTGSYTNIQKLFNESDYKRIIVGLTNIWDMDERYLKDQSNDVISLIDDVCLRYDLYYSVISKTPDDE